MTHLPPRKHAEEFGFAICKLLVLRYLDLTIEMLGKDGLGPEAPMTLKVFTHIRDEIDKHVKLDGFFPIDEEESNVTRLKPNLRPVK